MGFIRVKTHSTTVKFHYHISTPRLTLADKLDPTIPVVLFFHALAFPHVFHSESQFADPLLRKFNLVVFDLRSHGDTEGDDLPEGYGVKEAAEDALAFMDALRLPPCHIAAMDYGTPIALQLAISQPDRVLSLFLMSQTCLEEPPDVREGHQQVYDCWSASFPGPGVYDQEHMMEGGYGFAQFMFSNNLTNLAQAMFNITFVTAQKHWSYDGLKNYRIATRDFMFNRKVQSRAALSCIRCPVKVLYGTNDVAYNRNYSEIFIQNLKDAGVEATLHIVPNAPHFLNVEFADQVNPILHNFIMSNDSRRPSSVSGQVSSPWDSDLRAVGWNPDGEDEDSDDEFEITYHQNRIISGRFRRMSFPLKDLPLDLFPVIVHHVPHRELRSLCLANKWLYQFANPKLYERISVYAWHKHSKEKARKLSISLRSESASSSALQIILLFLTLSQHPHLAEHVQKLELRDFPKAISSDDGVDIPVIVIKALKHCVNLQTCIWTRDGSLNSGILEALQSSRQLQELEVNGHDQGNYDPNFLLNFTRLRRIQLIMPSASVISTLYPWLQLTGNSLRSLTIICKSSPLVTDAKLKSMALYLTLLERFHLTGCSRVTHHGIDSILSASENGIVSLGLEGLSPKFDMFQFRLSCSRTNAFRRLRSVTLTVSQQTPLDIWINEVIELLPSDIPLEAFQIYSSGAFIEMSLETERLWAELVAAHKDRLTRFSIHRMLISNGAIENICRQCTKLEALFVVIEQDSMDILPATLSLALNLRVVHVNHPLEAENAVPVLPEDDALAIVQRCSPTIMQFGCNTRVWQVDRKVLLDAQGVPVGIERRVVRYQGLDVPEAFLVVRT
ncbi:hypothetical protein D9757_004129 [Collybiopsis confluens]|uniref:F-box domain-containing protein n=1 Tax=Collybiopsis confluens TaxID=2823264 RepID=A0A8H5HUD2_9AGAR|nr:hypothetical protein D9757_004129 [Collybiopsis confluens]